MIDKANSTYVDDLVSLATISVLENMYESPSVICMNETIESPHGISPNKATERDFSHSNLNRVLQEKQHNTGN